MLWELHSRGIPFSQNTVICMQDDMKTGGMNFMPNPLQLINLKHITQNLGYLMTECVSFPYLCCGQNDQLLFGGW